MTYQELCVALRGEQMRKQASVKKLASIIGMKKSAANPYAEFNRPIDMSFYDQAKRNAAAELKSGEWAKATAQRYRTDPTYNPPMIFKGNTPPTRA